MHEALERLLQQAIVNDSQLILFAILLVTAIIVLDAITKVAALRRKQTGLVFGQIKSALPGRNWLPVKNFVATELGLAGKPDGLLLEEGHMIPVEFKPLGKKVRDRYIVQILVYLRLIEHTTGKRPPYGYLILGQKNKQIKIYNSDKKQAEIQTYVKTMQATALKLASTLADPTKYKCFSCNARSQCEFSFKEKY